MIVKVYSHEENLTPVCKTEDSAGYDIYCPEDTYVSWKRLAEVTVDTQIVLDGSECLEQFAIFLLPRSGLSSKLDIRLKNTVGVIDKDYVGPEDRMRAIIKMPLSLWLKHLITRKPLFRKGDRICQIVYLQVLKPRHVYVPKSLNENMNRGGFGSTGLK